MSEKEDVQEYVDETIKSFHIRRLLEWLSRIGDSQDQRMAVFDVCSSLLIFMLVSTSFAGFIIWLDILLHFLTFHPSNMPTTGNPPGRRSTDLASGHAKPGRTISRAPQHAAREKGQANVGVGVGGRDSR